jgi:hypothetical protein
MPGSLVHAECCCGFRRELGPGFSISGISYSIAYNADESDLLTMDNTTIKSAGFRTIPNPYFEASAGPHLCPQCKKVSLMLRVVGEWD